VLRNDSLSKATRSGLISTVALETVWKGAVWKGAVWKGAVWKGAVWKLLARNAESVG